MIEQRTSAGFSAVELMISLFIAVAFIATGYQLYSVVTRDGAAVRQRAQASNTAYEYLRTLSSGLAGNCSTSHTFSPTPALTTAEKSKLPESATLTAATSCPYGTSSAVWRLTVTVSYGTPLQEVSHAIFVAN